MSAAARRLRRARRRPARPGQDSADRALRCAIEVANAIGPRVAHLFAGLIAIKPSRAGEPVEVFAVDRWTHAPRCWGCGDELDDRVVGSTLLNSKALARDPGALVLIRQCDRCATEMAPTATRSASA